jgi:hypothetical protein
VGLTGKWTESFCTALGLNAITEGPGHTTMISAMDLCFEFIPFNGKMGLSIRQ